jgi:oligopeptidase B
MGYQWYEDGKLFKRLNTFHDFIDAAKHLEDAGFTSAGNISASGGSAGGQLMGLIANLEPDLWRAIVAAVPFVDVLNTMLDKDLPLTPIEWPEWGNPLDSKKAFEFIASYSSYDNVEAMAYPPILVTAGLNDPRVTYWEPAKWTARLRATRTDDHLLLLKTNMGAGHGGPSGRFTQLYELAEEYTFLLLAFAKTEPV